MKATVLQGIHVVSTAINIPGPVAAAHLAGLGARVTKVEPPAGDPLALFSPDWYDSLTHGQQILTLDLKSAAGRDQLDSMLATADVLLTASRPAALARLGLDWEHLHARFPRLCHVGIVGFPPPADDESGHDLTYQARLGLLQPPRMPVTLIADLAGAERAVSATLALLLQRERQRAAAQSWVSLAEAAAPFADPVRYAITTPGGALGGGLPGYRVYQARDGFIAVAALEPHFLERLETELDMRPLTHEALENLFRTRDAAHWETWARERDIPLAKVNEHLSSR